MNENPAKCKFFKMASITRAIIICRNKIAWFDMWYEHSQTQVSVQGTVDLWSYILPIDRYSHTLTRAYVSIYR